ncbi:MAG: DnaJ domain-containing protein [Desulfobacteraceae bacterium]
MSTYYKVLLVLIVLAYVVSPIDLIPDIFIPYIGLIDDTFLMGLLVYYLKFGRLPGIFSRWKTQQTSNTKNSNSGNKTSNGKGRRSDNQKAHSASAASSFPKTPEEVLGVRKGASREEIQAAYRKAVKAYHPDRVANLGPELQELANEKFLEIKTAYDTLINP